MGILVKTGGGAVSSQSQESDDLSKYAFIRPASSYSHRHMPLSKPANTYGQMGALNL